ncbi:MAG: 3-deoxy-manno-octulosonate cytidylyltransferase [Clostridium sp.]|jgi:3-deoxy-manno-octulosonate cytidylyltransferase (CMP-KDO synthetase)|nr:3-deoxy-manno-octulosonate cytidylyltransferase [Clostridium sp.]
MNGKVIGVIPARYESTRFPGKPLADICGKPMIWWVWNTARQVSELDELYVATDDKRIADAVREFGGNYIMTGDCATGTDRVAEAALTTNGSIYVNIQGDEPLLKPETISQAIATLADEGDYYGTLAVKIADQDEIDSPHNVKIVVDSRGYAMYYSRSPVPSNSKGYAGCVYKHLGIYVYRKGFLLDFAHMKPTELELSEGIEPLRALYNGYKMKVGITENNSIGVDTIADLEYVRNWLSHN